MATSIESKADDRLPPKLLAWTSEAIGYLADCEPAHIDWRTIAGDASPRRYFRATPTFHRGQNDHSHRLHSNFVVMDCPPDESMHAFSDVAEKLSAEGLRAPTIHALNREEGYLLLEDFGDRLLKDEIDLQNGNSIFANEILPLLKGMQQVSCARLPAFSAEKLDEELELFIAWFCERHCQTPLEKTEREQWTHLKSILLDNAATQKQGFVHRDFHCCNVMRCDDGALGILDFQDAVCGPVSYDLVSWIWDRYITWPRPSVERWLLQAGKLLAPDTAEHIWIRQCDLMSLQRNLKIVGIFCRLNYRDHKQSYLQLMPQFARYILQTLPAYKELEQCGEFVRNRLASLVRAT